jgi:hypothetical protein
MQKLIEIKDVDTLPKEELHFIAQFTRNQIVIWVVSRVRVQTKQFTDLSVFTNQLTASYRFVKDKMTFFKPEFFKKNIAPDIKRFFEEIIPASNNIFTQEQMERGLETFIRYAD